jgi:gluconolactonase
VELDVVCEGLEFPEGPVAMADGSVILVEMRRRTLTRVTPSGSIEVIARVGGGPNGAAIGPDGAVYICNNGGSEWIPKPGGGYTIILQPDDYVGGSIQRVDLGSSAVETLYEACDGRRLSAPNDLVFDDAGGFWFTDLGKNNTEHRKHGALYYARADGSEIRRICEPMFSPNGVGLSPDGKALYVAETPTARVLVFELQSPGCLRQTDEEDDPEALPRAAFARVLGPPPGYQMLDSLAVEAGGKICVATLLNGGITVFDPVEGFEHFPVPDPMTTNICFGGPDMQDAWITGAHTGRLFHARWPRPGLRLAHNR